MASLQLSLMKVLALVFFSAGLAEDTSISAPYHEPPGSKAQLLRTFPENRIDLATVAEMAEYNALVGRVHPPGWPNFEAMSVRHAGKGQHSHGRHHEALKGTEWAVRPDDAGEHEGRHHKRFRKPRQTKDLDEDTDLVASVEEAGAQRQRVWPSSRNDREGARHQVRRAEVADPDVSPQHNLKLRGSDHEESDSMHEARFNVERRQRHKARKAKESGDVAEIIDALRKERTAANPERSRREQHDSDLNAQRTEVWDSKDALGSENHVEAKRHSDAKLTAVSDVSLPSQHVFKDPPTSRLKATKLAWLHIPETGISFANTLASWACPHLEDKLVVDGSSDRSGGTSLSNFLDKHQKDCSEGFQFCEGHVPMARGSCNDWDEHHGYFIGMFRQPEQRIMAGFNAGCRSLPESDCSLKEYASSIAGCSVRMMNGEECGSNATTTGDMVTRAIQRLEEGFSFVGLTEEWALSVCLFHAMFGGECHEREFANVHPGERHSDLAYDTSELGDWVDPWDAALYSHAYATFWNNIAKYGVTPDTCTKSFCSSVSDTFKASLLKQG